MAGLRRREGAECEAGWFQSRPESREGEENRGAGGLCLIWGGGQETEAGHPENRTPDPFVHQTSQLLEGPRVSWTAAFPFCFSTGREKGREATRREIETVTHS